MLEAFQRARTLFPFPILGLDVDCSSEFLNEQMVAYCTREQIMLTRGRPTMKNDQCFVEAKNRHIVRQIVGHDRYCGDYASRQMTEVYRALRLYINCFQPSMRLIANEEETNAVCRRYDPAKTPLQRVLLFGVLSPAKEQELLAVVQALDPVRLLDQIEQLQYALFRCAINASPFSHHQLVTPIQVFAWERCTDGSLPPCLHPAPAGSSTSTKELPVECLLGWKRYRTNPFEEEWECIASCLQEHPDLTAAALFRQLQNSSPGRYHQGQLRCLQRGGRLIRTQLLAMRDDPDPAELIHGTLPAFVLPSSLALAESASEEAQVDSSEKDSLRAAPSLHRADRLPKAMCARHANGKQEISPGHSGLFPTDHGAQRPQDNPLAQAIQAYLQE